MKPATLSPTPSKPVSTLVLDVKSIGMVLDEESSPFAGPHLHPEAAAHIMLEARSFPKTNAIEIIFRVPSVKNGDEGQVREAVHSYAREVEREAAKQVKEVMRDGRYSLVIGVMTVGLLRSLTELLPLLGDYAALKGLSESLIIFYWVILWRPADLLLYEHIPPRRRRRLAGLLAQADVRVECVATSEPGN